jgi:hypothetical protein
LVVGGAYFSYRRQAVAEEDSSGYYELKDVNREGTKRDGDGLGAPGVSVGPTQNPSHVVGSLTTTGAAKQACAVAWRSSPKANTDVSLKSHHHVSYNDIDFARAVQIGDGGSCTVFKTEVYGMPCAVKVLSDSARAWAVRLL